MIIKYSKSRKIKRGDMKIASYEINPDFSAALIGLNGRHGKIKCLSEDRIYFITSGKGRFIINGKSNSVSKGDLIFIPKKTPYDISGKMKYFLVCSPAFSPKHDISLK